MFTCHSLGHKLGLWLRLRLSALLLAATAALMTVLGAHAQEPDTLTGTLTWLWTDGYVNGELIGAPPVLTLVDAQNNAHVVTIDPTLAEAHGGIRQLLGTRVTVRVQPAVDGAQPDALAIQALLEVAATEANVQRPISGNERWLILLCRPPEYTQMLPNALPHYNGLLANSAPGMDHYWRELSYGAYSVAQSQAFGWYTLPKPWTAYVETVGGTTRLLDKPVVDDCTALADGDVNFPQYDGIAFVVPAYFLGYGGDRDYWIAYGYTSKATVLTRDGVERSYRSVFIPSEIGNPVDRPDAWQARVLAHEMGHTLGLMHSSGAYGNAYDSNWDVMSGGRYWDYAGENPWGSAGVHTIAWHKWYLGWVAPAQTVVAPAGASRMLALARLGRPVAGVPLYVQMPRPGSTTRFYTAEARGWPSYDRGTPDAVVLHDVDTTRTDRMAQVVDADVNGDPNDASAQWLPGETFSDAATGIQLCVEARTSFGYLVGVASGGAAACSFAPHFATTTALGYVPSVAGPGQTVRHKLEITNGGSAAQNVRVTLTLPPELTVLTPTVEVTNGVLQSLQPLVFAIGAMEYDEYAQLAFDVRADPALTGPITPTTSAVVSWDGGSSNLISSARFNDSTAPESTIHVEGSQTPDGAYAGPVQVTLEAGDGGAGLLATHYSLDGGVTWKLYTGPVPIPADTRKTVHVFSIDRAGNEERPVKTLELRFVGAPDFARAYLPAISNLAALTPPGMRYVAAGPFQMGCSPADTQCGEDERPLHTVTLSAYFIDKHEVTMADYAACMASGRCTGPSLSAPIGQYTPAWPVLAVTWHQAAAYCAWAGKRLPSEAEWEKAARGVDTRIYPWGDAAPNATLLNFNNPSGNPSLVGSYPAGASYWGALDMSGNALEWVNDWYEAGYYASSPAMNPQGPSAGEWRVLRGGTWRSEAADVRLSGRVANSPDGVGGTFGFRCARTQ